MARKYYAKRSPRGFGNEIEVYSFPSKRVRDKFVEDKNEWKTGAIPVTKREAEKIKHYKGNDFEKSYNSFIEYEISNLNESQCEANGGEYVHSYYKNGRKINGYCRRPKNF